MISMREGEKTPEEEQELAKLEAGLKSFLACSNSFYDVNLPIVKFLEIYLIHSAIDHPDQYENRLGAALDFLERPDVEISVLGKSYQYSPTKTLIEEAKETYASIAKTSKDGLKKYLQTLYSRMDLDGFVLKFHGNQAVAIIPNQFQVLLNDPNLEVINIAGFTLVNADIYHMRDLVSKMQAFLSADLNDDNEKKDASHDSLMLKKESERLNTHIQNEIITNRAKLLENVGQMLLDAYNQDVPLFQRDLRILKFGNTTYPPEKKAAQWVQMIIIIKNYFEHEIDKLALNAITTSLKSILADHLKIDPEFSHIVILLENFLDEEKLHCPNTYPLGVVLELLAYTLHPSSLDQKQTSLCGISSTMSALLHASPEMFIKVCFDVAKTGSTGILSAKAHKDTVANEREIYAILLAAIKNFHNKTGYSMHSNSFFPHVRGLTRPKEIASILSELGFSNIQDFTLIYNSDNTLCSNYFLSALGGVYDEKKHIEINDLKQNFMHLIENLAKGQTAIMLVNMNLVSELLSTSIPATLLSKMLQIEDSHYVYVKSLALDNDTNVKVTIETYGKEFTHTFPLDKFLKGYRGAITADPSNVELTPKQVIDVR